MTNFVTHEIKNRDPITSLKTEEMTIPPLGSFECSPQKTLGFLGESCFHMARSVCEGRCLPHKGSQEQTLFRMYSEECPAPPRCELVHRIHLASYSCTDRKGVHCNMYLIHPQKSLCILKAP